MAGTVVAENIADPVNSPGHGVAWLIFVNIGKIACLLAVPGQAGGAEVRREDKMRRFDEQTLQINEQLENENENENIGIVGCIP